MITFEDALKQIVKNVKKLPAKRVGLHKSLGMILAQDLYSSTAMPRFDKSAMDGYAVKAKDLKTIPAHLCCLGIIEAGSSFRKALKNGECVKIMTGAPVPKGADSVVMVEHTRKNNDSVCFLKGVAAGENICREGEDIRAGQKVLAKGRKISVSDISLIAAIGRRSFKVIGKPRVAILNTGGEIIPIGKKLAKFKIYNSNGPQLEALIMSDGIEPVFLGIAKDAPGELERAIKKGLGCELFLISGGVSMGDYDLVPEILKKCGVREIFHQVKIKPGKPLFFGLKKTKAVFGIPGNPVSNFLAYQVFIRPALRKMMGLPDFEPCFKKGVLTKEFQSKGERKHFVPANVSERQPYSVTPLSTHGSADILTLSRADAFMAADEGKVVLRKGAKVSFISWRRDER